MVGVDDRFVIVDEEGVVQRGFLPSLTSTALRGLRSITCLRPPVAFIATATCLVAGTFSLLRGLSTPNEVFGFHFRVFPISEGETTFSRDANGLGEKKR